MSERIVIANSTIRQQDGLYCLNDWHCAYYGRDLCRQTISDYLFFFEKFNGEAEHETF